MDLFSWILTSLTAITALALIVLTIKDSKRWQFAMGLAIGGLGIALAAQSTLEGMGQGQKKESPLASESVEAPDISQAESFASLPLPASFDTHGFRTISLAQPGEDLSALERTGPESDHPAIVILDASNGIHPDYLERLSRAFGPLKPAASDEKIAICWRRTPFFPLATGRCNTRPVQFTMDAGPNDLARAEGERGTVRLKSTANTNFVLVTHAIPEKNRTSEESCLLALARGELCAAAEILPGPTTAAISIDSEEPVNRQVLEEFSLAQKKELIEALRVYEETDQPKFEKIRNLQADGTCRGLADHARLVATDLTWLTESLQSIKKESELGKELLKLNGYLDCPGLLTLSLPSLKLRDQRSAARSLLTHLQDFTFWFTSPLSYLHRAHKVDKVTIGADQDGTRIWIQSPDSLQSLAIAIVAPLKFPEEILQNIRILRNTSEWRLYRLGPNGFRITQREAAPIVAIDLGDFMPTVTQPKLKLKTFLRTSGVSSSLQIAYLIAAIFALVHALAPHGPQRHVRWATTFIPVASIAFILVFLSHQTARRPAGNDASMALVEDPTLPTHLFLRDWPSEWFSPAPPSAAELAISADMQKRNARWLKLLADGQEKAAHLVSSAQVQRDVVARTSGTSIGSATRGSREVVIWDNPRARNFFFRKSPVYQGTMIGWQHLVDREQQGWNLSEAASASAAITSPESVIVIPDLRFVTGDDLAALDSHVASGGILVFSERLALDDLGGSELTAEALKSAGGIGQAILAAGYGKTKVSRYSPVATDGFEVENINVEHRVSARTGHGPAWVNGVSYKSGAVIFLGVQPSEARTQSVVTTVLRRLQGERRSLRDPGPGCATALFVQPFGASLPTMTSFAAEVRRNGIEVHWIVDPVSFARMMPIWEKTFKTDGVVFLDDGRPETRLLGADLLHSLKGDDVRPVFATLRPSGDAQLEGPASDLILARELVTTSLDESVKQWASECTKGTAAPRLVSSAQDVGEWMKRATEISHSGPRQTLGLRQYIERKQLPAAADGPRRNYRFKTDDPLQMILEQQ